jgi:hypothetical protein
MSSNTHSKDILRINSCDDRGVILNHISRDYKDMLSGSRISSDLQETLASNTLHYEPLAEVEPRQDPKPNQSRNTNELLSYDPFARELYVPDMYNRLHDKSEDIDKVRNFQESEINHHERIHDLLSSREGHVYLIEKLLSYQRLIDYIRWPSQRTSHGIKEAAKGVRMKLMVSQLIQEGVSIHRQRKFLESTGGSSTEELLELTNYKKAAERFLESDVSPEAYLERCSPNDPVRSYPTHVVGHYLYSQAEEVWEMDISEFLFRIFARIEFKESHMPQNYSGILGEEYVPIVPDQALQICTDPDIKPEVAECETRDQKEELLAEVINRKTSTDISSDGRKPQPGGLSLSGGGGEWIERHKVRSRIMKRREIHRILIEKAIEQNAIYRIPLVASSYPGLADNQTLWNVLQSLYTISDPSGTRVLFIEEDVLDWAANTDILRYAIQLWELREKIYMPYFRRISSYKAYRPKAALQWLTGKGTISQFQFEEPSNWEFNFEKEIAVEEYQDLRRDLTNLGHAIIDKDTDAIRRHF